MEKKPSDSSESYTEDCATGETPMENAPSPSKEERDPVEGAVRRLRFTSDSPFIPECEVISEGNDEFDAERNCPKRLKHKKFIPVKDFKKEDLPKDLQTDEIMKQIKIWCDKTVKITVKYTSIHRPDTFPDGKNPYPYSHLRGSKRRRRMGTGHIMDTLIKRRMFWPDTVCPCHLCRDSPNPEKGYLEVDVSTVAHVVFDTLEARQTVVELFFDNLDDKDGVKYLYGYKLKVDGIDDSIQKLKAYEDGVIIKCATHDKAVMELLPPMDFSIVGSLKQLPIGASSGIIISHPHGLSKHISVGGFIHQNSPLPLDYKEDSQFRVGPGAKFRFYDDCPALRISAFERYAGIRSSNGLKSKVEYTLMTEMFVTLLPESKYLFQSKDLYIPWISFPEGTHLHFPVQHYAYLILSGTMEFNLKGTNNTIYTEQHTFENLVVNDGEPYYVTYDINTCPGSSGAPVMFSSDGRFWTTHFGALKDGTNRSGVCYHIFDREMSSLYSSLYSQMKRGKRH